MKTYIPIIILVTALIMLGGYYTRGYFVPGAEVLIVVAAAVICVVGKVYEVRE